MMKSEVVVCAMFHSLPTTWHIGTNVNKDTYSLEEIPEDDRTLFWSLTKMWIFN